MWRRSRSTNIVEFTAKNVLLFQVQTHIAQNYLLLWTDSSVSIVYVVLRGHEGRYGATQDDAEIKTCK